MLSIKAGHNPCEQFASEIKLTPDHIPSSTACHTPSHQEEPVLCPKKMNTSCSISPPLSISLAKILNSGKQSIIKEQTKKGGKKSHFMASSCSLHLQQ